MKKNIILFLVVPFFLSTSLQAQHGSSIALSAKPSCIIEGRISDLNGQSLEGALVYIPELNLSCVTDHNGHYFLKNLPARSLDVQFSFLGYAHQLKKIQVSQERAVLNVLLEPSPIEAEEIVVTGGRYSTQHQNAVKIDVLTLDAHDLQPTPNFAEMLTRIPGVDMISKGSGVSKPVIRGLSMNDILILDNGVRFENYQYSSHHPLGIDEFGVERVEVIKGPASLLYGSDAIGGVLNFMKEKPAPQYQILGDYQMQLFSNSLGENMSLGLKGSGERFFGGIRLSQKSHADYLQGGGGYLPNSRFNEASIKTNVGYNASLGSFHLFYDYSQQNLGLVEEEAIEGIDKRGRHNELFFQRLNTLFLSSQNKIYLGATRLDLNAAFQNTELTHFGEVNEHELQMQFKTLTYEAKVQLPSNTTSAYILGFQGEHQENANLNDRETILLPNALIDNYSGFGFFQQSFGRVNLQTGLRYDYKTLNSQAVGNADNADTYRAALDKDYGSYSGSLGFTYHPTDELFFRSNLALAYRTPNLAELTSNGPHEAIYELGDDQLQPERSLEFDLSVHWHKKYFTFDLAGFYNRVNDFIYQSPTGEATQNGISIYRYRQSDSKLYGGEAGIHVHPALFPWLHIESSYSWVIGRKNSGEYLPFIPAHKLNFELKGEKDRLAFFQNTFVGLKAHYALDQERPAPEETSTPGYSLYDINLGGTLHAQKQPLILVLAIKNLLDARYVDHLSTLKEVGGFNPGRNFIFSLKIPLNLK